MKLLYSAALVLLAAVPAYATGPEDLLGTWYYGGDPNQPCVIGLRDRGPQGVIMTFTNAQGQTVEGKLQDDVTVIAGPTFDQVGRLSGDPRYNGAISWNTGAYWTRVPERPAGWNAPYEGYRDRDYRDHNWRRPDSRDRDGRYRRR
jgi:hypothetical protein